MRLSSFEKWILFYIIIISSFVLLFNYAPADYSLLYLLRMAGLLLCVLLFLVSTFEFKSEVAEEMIVFKYKVVYKEGGWKEYKAKMLTLGYLFIPWWAPVDTETSSFDYQNIFGADTTSYSQYNVEYRTESKARNAIEKHRAHTKRERKKFFKRPDKKEKRTTYV